MWMPKEISTLTSLRDVTEKPPEKKHHQTNFYSHISARCDQIASDVVAGGYDFYSHISARCDWCYQNAAQMLRNFYSHISARCDNQLIEEMAELTHFYSHISARCDILSFSCSTSVFLFLLSHLCEM